MSFDAEDPKWTAYVLDELSADERCVIAQELAESADARQLVAEIRETTGLLAGELQGEPVFQLAADQRAAIEELAGEKVSVAMRPKRRWRRLSLSLAVAATLLLAVGVLLVPSIKMSREVARRNSNVNEVKQIG